MTDGDLVRQILAGTTAAYGTLAGRWKRARSGRLSFAGRSRRCGGFGAGALLRGLRALPTLSEPEKFGPWLIGIAVRTCLDWLKSAKRTEVSLDVIGAGDDGVGDDHLR